MCVFCTRGRKENLALSPENVHNFRIPDYEFLLRRSKSNSFHLYFCLILFILCRQFQEKTIQENTAFGSLGCLLQVNRALLRKNNRVPGSLSEAMHNRHVSVTGGAEKWTSSLFVLRRALAETGLRRALAEPGLLQGRPRSMLGQGLHGGVPESSQWRCRQEWDTWLPPTNGLWESLSLIWPI